MLLYNQINSNEIGETKLKKYDLILLCLCIVDTLFFPYIKFISASISMILLPIWFIFNFTRLNLSKRNTIILTAMIFMILSFLISTVTVPSFAPGLGGVLINVISTNLKNLVIILYGLLYCVFYEFIFNKCNVSLKKVLTLYIIFVFLLSLIYIINPQLYFNVRAFWTMGGNAIIITDSLSIFRYTGTFSDPNNIATAIVGVFAFLWFNEKTSAFLKVFSLITTTIILVSTMSNTGIICFAIVGFCIIVNMSKEGMLFLFKNKKINLSTFWMFFFLCLSLPLLIYGGKLLSNNEIFEIAFNRIESNSGESRFTIWMDLIQKNNFLKYLIIGQGGTIINDGRVRAPHNGHFFMFLGYGFIAYVTFLISLFKFDISRIKKYVFLIPFFIGFTLNVGIYEPRYINLLVLLIAANNVVEQREQKQKENNFGI